MAQSILYYPSINIPDGLWLRNAILYWDRIYSIVPFEGYHDFSSELWYLKSVGVYNPLYPADIFRKYIPEEVLKEFEQCVCKKIKKQIRMKTNCNYSSQIHINKFNYSNIPEMIHYNKFSNTIFQFLIESGLINSINNTSDGWFLINEDIGTIYMKTLAEFISRYSEEAIVIGTDKPSSIRNLFPYLPKHRQNFCFSLIMERCLPQPTLDTNIEKLLEFKENRNNELLIFRQKLRSFENKISSCTSPEEIKAEIESFRESWELELSQIDKLFKAHDINYYLGNAKTLIESAALSFGLLDAIRQYTDGSIPNWLFATNFLAASTIGLGINYIDHKQKSNVNNNTSGFAYITSAYKHGFILRSPFYETL